MSARVVRVTHVSPCGDGVPSQTRVMRVTHVRPCGEGDPCQPVW